MAAPTLVINKVCDQQVNNGEVTITSPVSTWQAEGTATSDAGKPILAIYGMLGFNLIAVAVPLGTVECDVLLTVPTITSDGVYHLYVTAVNEDGATTVDITITASGFVNPTPIPIPTPTPPPPGPHPVL